MHKIRTILRFGWVYLRRYWFRLTAGVLLGVMFGLTNASFIWATKTLIERFAEKDGSALLVSSKPALQKTSSAWSSRLKKDVNEFIEPWLPRAGRNLDWRQMLGGVLFLALLASVRGSTNYLSSYCIGWVSERMIRDMRMDVLKKFSTLSLDFFTRSTTGDLLTRINGDTANLLRCLKVGAADLVKESISLVSILGMLFWINWKLTLFGMIFVPFCLFPLLVLAKKARKASKAGLGGEVMLTSQLVELLGSIRVIKAFNLEKERLDRYQEISKNMVSQGMKNLKAKELVTPLIEVISMLGLGVVIIFIFKTQTSVSDFVGFLTGMMLFFVPLKKLAAVHILFEQTSPGVQRLINILNVQPTVKEPVNPKPLKGFRRAITFENVTFAYEARPVIRNLNLTIPYGAKIGLAGPSGSGKSTLVNLLFRFYDPTQGSIEIDGVDLRETTFHDLRHLMALVSQEVVIFDQSVAENIACGRPGATPDEVEAAARAAYAHDFIVQLPKKYNTRLGERGVKLSGGQRQRVAIARAFIRNAPILVFDEATASLDSEAEAEVQRAIDHISENRTVISVAHRLSTLATSHQIIVLSEGRIIEQGAFDDLLHAGGTFAAMTRRQGILPSKGILGMVKQG